MNSLHSTTRVFVRRDVNWSSAPWEVKASIVLPAMATFIGLLVISSIIVLVLRERGRRRAAFATLAFSALFYITTNLVALVGNIMMYKGIDKDGLQQTQRLGTATRVLQQFELILALTTVALLLDDRANSFQSLGHGRRAMTILKWVAVSLLSLSAISWLLSSVLETVAEAESWSFTWGQANDSQLHYDVGIAFFQLLRGTFMVALTVILASGVVIWRQFTRAGQRDLPTIAATSIGVPLLFAGWVVVLLFGYGMRIYEGTGFAVVMLYSIFSLVFYAIFIVLGFKRSFWSSATQSKHKGHGIELNNYRSDSASTINRLLNRPENLEEHQSS